MRRMMTIALAMLAASTLFTAQAAKPPPPDEEANDGLQRVEVSQLQELYVAPGVSLAHYKRVMMDPIEVEFRRGWRKKHPDMSEQDLADFRQLLIGRLHDTVVSELAKGGYTVAEAAAPDVLRIQMTIADTDFEAPEIAQDKSTVSYIDGKMTLRLHGYDAASGTLVTRARDHREHSRSPVPERADRATALRNAQQIFEQWAQDFRSALDVSRVKPGQEAAQN